MEIEAYNVIRIIIVLISGLSIYFGYQLFKSVTETQGKLKISGQDSTIELSDVGPGIYFSLFGSIVLVAVLLTQPYLETTSVAEKGSSISDSTVVTRVKSRTPASDESTNELSIESHLDGACIEDGLKEHYQSVLAFLAYVKMESKGQSFAKPSEDMKRMLKDSISKSVSGVDFKPLIDDIKTNIDVKNIVLSYLVAYSVANQCE